VKTIFQDYEGSITELNGQKCKALLCVQVIDGEKRITPGVFWLNVCDGRWHRFFLDSSYYFLSWTEYNELNLSDLEDDDYPVLDVGKKFGLEDCKIAKIEMRQVQVEMEHVGLLIIYFSEERTFELKQSGRGAVLTVL